MYENENISAQYATMFSQCFWKEIVSENYVIDMYLNSAKVFEMFQKLFRWKSGKAFVV